MCVEMQLCFRNVAKPQLLENEGIMFLRKVREQNQATQLHVLEALNPQFKK